MMPPRTQSCVAAADSAGAGQPLEVYAEVATGLDSSLDSVGWVRGLEDQGKGYLPTSLASQLAYKQEYNC